MDPSHSPEVVPSDADDILEKLDSVKLEGWKGWFSYMVLKLIIYIGKDPYGFLVTVMIVLTPMLILSAYCAYKLSGEINRKKSEEKAKARRSAVLNKLRKQVKMD